MAMIKAARAYTGKPKIAKAEGAYHGTYDFAEISQSPNPENWGDIDQPNSVPLSHGTPQGVLDDVIIFPFNDSERTIHLLDQNKEKLAAVMIDLVPHRVGLVAANADFIEEIYNWTRKNNVLLIFDEVITFRVRYGGAQEDYPVKPDLTALGKIIGGGFPVGAFAGRSEIMKVLDPGEKKLLFPFSGTFSANPVTMTAGRVAMELYDTEAIRAINEITARAKSQIEEAAVIADVPVCLTGAGSMFRFHPKPDPPKNYREAYQPKEVTRLISEILDYMFYTEKIMLINTVSGMFSTAITQKEVDRLSEAFLNMFRIFKSKIDIIQ
jgi:glutamate-1-semialdehyde 2,1-aminomutase